MDKIRILIVEDEQKIREALTDFFEFQGFEVAVACDGLEAKNIVSKTAFDLILLDLMLPKISGEELCLAWRCQDLRCPIIMLTAKGQEKERVNGLNLGADDYITKPFSLEELLARINAVLRRTDPARGVGKNFSFGPWQIDISTLTIKKPGLDVAISSRESKIIQYFAANPNRIISREELYHEVWEDEITDLGTRTTDMHIAKLRGKLEDDCSNPKIIVTVRGAGYKYEWIPDV